MCWYIPVFGAEWDVLLYHLFASSFCILTVMTIVVVPCQLYMRCCFFSCHGIVLCPILAICDLLLLFSMSDAWPGTWRTSKAGEKRNSANWVFHCNILCGNLLTKTWRRSGSAEKLQSVILTWWPDAKKTFGSLNEVLYVLWISWTKSTCIMFGQCCLLMFSISMWCRFSMDS